MKIFAILGHPVSHSLSPKLHNAVFQEMGLKDHVYEYYDCPPEKLEEAIQEMREGKWEGFSVTIPYKKEVMKYLDVVDGVAKKVGAVNTILRREDGALVGMNTDYVGVLKSFEEAGVTNNEKRITNNALVLGSGGAAQAVIAVLKDLGCKVAVASRSGKEGAVAYDQLNPDDDYELIVNTTPVGMQKTNNEKRITNNELLLAADEWYRADRVYFDVVYTPKMTPFLQRALDARARIITGDRMFLWQAVEQAKMFTGRDEVPVEMMERVIEEEIR